MSDLDLAQAKSDAARARLTGTLVEIQAKLNPRVLLREAIEDVRSAAADMVRSGLDQARNNPGPWLSLAATGGAYLARQWLNRRARRTAEQADDTPPAPSNHRQRADRRRAKTAQPNHHKRRKDR